MVIFKAWDRENFPLAGDHPVKSGRCMMEAPDGSGKVCTREDGHDGTHEAGITHGGIGHIVAQWSYV